VSYLTPLRSDLKLSILLSLLEGKKKLADIGKETKTRETTILHVLKELEQLELTTKSGGTYQLTQLGILETEICKGCYQSFETLKKHKEFWLTHDVSCIPPSLMKRVGDLEDSVLVKASAVELQKVHETGVDLLFSAKTILGVSPIFHPDFVVCMENVLRNGGNVTLIFTPAVSELFNQATKESEDWNRYISNGNLQIYINEDLNFSITVTEKIWAFGLFHLSGEYDYTADLRGTGEEGLEWGNQLFRKTLEKSTKTG
jgi:predicted transcriptional regulator